MAEVECEVLIIQTQRYCRRHMAQRFQRNAIERRIDEMIHIIGGADLAQPGELALNLNGRQPTANREIEVSTFWLKQAWIAQGNLPTVCAACLQGQGQHT
ncbi:hypothetical protein D3C80_1503990 [compost metagenome]